MKTALIILIIVMLVIAFPLCFIWSLNTLFALGIEYTFWNWLAALLLGSFVQSSTAKQ
jgi:hypothetical protein